MFPRFSLARLGQILSWPLSRMLLLSLALHVAAVMLIQPRPGRAPTYAEAIRASIVPAASPIEDSMPVPDETVPDDLLAALDLPAPAETVPGMDTAQEAATEAVVPEARGNSQPAPQVADPDLNPSRLPAQATPDLLPSIPVMLDTTWYSARQLDVQPKAREHIQPVYPESARLDGLVGTVTLVLRIDERGEVNEVTVESGDPPGVFEDSARAAFAAARFSPARLAGRPVRAEIRIRVTYRLND